MTRDRPLRLTDDQLRAIMSAARPIRRRDRGAFLEAVAAAIRGRDVGDGSVFRAIRDVQREFFAAPGVLRA